MNSGSRDAQLESPLVGRTLRNTYRISRLIDQGGMGLVFEAEHLRLKTRVAVKVLPQHLIRDEYALARFCREAEIVALLKHPNIVQVIDFDTTEDKQPYIVMELLAGESLAARLEREPRLSLATVVRVAVQTAAALSAVHQASIVHRDLKPGNMFLTELQGEGLWLKLLDFGISKRAQVGQGLTGEHDVIGTADYMSPEQALGRASTADHRSDQFSLAVIVYEMLSGRAPFIGRNEMEILSQVISAKPPALPLIVPGLSARVAAVVERAMAKLPEDRFQSIEAFASELGLAAGVSLTPSAPPPAATLRLTSDPAVLTIDPKRSRTDSGLRPKTPNRKAPTVRGLSPRDKLHGLLGRVERAYAGKDVERAAELVELALASAEQMPEEQTRAALSQTQALLVEVLEARIGELSRRLRANSPASGVPRSSSSQEAFLLSNAEEGFTIEELVDASPISRLETLRLIARLLSTGRLV